VENLLVAACERMTELRSGSYISLTTHTIFTQESNISKFGPILDYEVL